MKTKIGKGFSTSKYLDASIYSKGFSYKDVQKIQQPGIVSNYLSSFERQRGWYSGKVSAFQASNHSSAEGWAFVQSFFPPNLTHFLILTMSVKYVPYVGR